MRTLRQAGSIRSILTKILIGALVPMVFLGVWQGVLTYDGSQNLVAQRLRANAWGIAEGERDPFIIARRSLQMLSRLDPIERNLSGCDQVLIDAREGAIGISNFLRADRNGAIRCSALPYAPGQTISGNAWPGQFKSQDTFFLGDPAFDDASKQPTLQLYLPLYDRAGRFDGVIGARISLEWLSRSIGQRQRERGGVAMLVNRDGKVFFSSGPSRFTGLARVRDALQAPQAIQSADGKQWTYATAPIFDRELFIAYAEPRANFANAAVSPIWLILPLPLLVTALSLIGVWFAAHRYLLDWFPRLHRLTQRIVEGQLIDERHQFAGAPAEVTAIADQLHAIAGALEGNRTALQASLEMQKSLTRELNHRVRNNIQIIVSLLTMQAERVPQGWMRELLDQARARVSAIGLVQRFAHDQHQDGPSKVTASELLADLCAQVRAANRDGPELDFQVEADATCKLRFDHAVPLMLFALEVISDAASHGARQIAVRLMSEDRGCRLEISGSNGAAPPNRDFELLGALAEQVSGHFGTEARGAQGLVWLEFPGD